MLPLHLQSIEGHGGDAAVGFKSICSDERGYLPT